MKITYYGHSCFVIESAGWRVCLDPFSGVKGYAELDIEADEVYCSHGHFDHNHVQAVRLSGRPASESPFRVTEVKTWHDPAQGRLRGENTIRVFEAEGLRVAHFGDLGCDPEPEQMEMLAGLDAAMMPVGGTYTVDAAQSKCITDALGVHTVIPMHYRKWQYGFPELTTIDDYTKLCSNVVYAKSNSAELSAPADDCVLVLQIPENKG